MLLQGIEHPVYREAETNDHYHLRCVTQYGRACPQLCVFIELLLTVPDYDIRDRDHLVLNDRNEEDQDLSH